MNVIFSAFFSHFYFCLFYFEFNNRISDLFHWHCFNAWALSLPPNTAPAGYRCPLCNEAVFPPPNQTSPTVDKLRDILKEASWARVGLGFPLVCIFF